MKGPLADLLNDENWDAPFFKKLPKNDSGDRTSNQAGFVVVRDLEPFFPSLDESDADARRPTVERWIRVELFVELHSKGSSSVRYQIQTWGGTRHEARVTDGTQILLDDSHKGDVVVIQRSRDYLDRFRFILVQQSGPNYRSILSEIGSRRWGSLFLKQTPLAQSEFIAAKNEMISETQLPFSAELSPVNRQQGQRMAIAQSVAFRQTIVEQHTGRCAVSGISLKTPDNSLEVQAAHIIPLNCGGPDEPRNGLSLTSTLHWAFDRGLFAIDSKRKVVVPRVVLDMPENKWLLQYRGARVAATINADLAAADMAFHWHREHLYSKWK
jgi:putative restriction endonuclease